MTEHQLRTGRPGPLSSMEFIDWVAFMRLEAEDRVEVLNKHKVRPTVIVESLTG